MGDDLNIPQSVDPQLLQQVSQAAQSTPLPTTQGSGMGAQSQGPPKPRPILMDLFQGLFGSQDSRGYGAAQNGQQARPVSRLDVFENFLGNFVQAMGAGLSEAHGHGAAAKGFGAAIQAPYQQAVGQYQLGQQAQANQAETQLKQAQASQLQNVVQTPYGPMSAALAAKIWPAEIAAGAKTDVAKINATSRMSVEQMKLAVTTNQISKVEPATDEDGKFVMRAYNKQGQPIGDLDGAIPPASYLPKTSSTVEYKQQDDGSYVALPKSTTSGPVLPSGTKSPNGSSRIPKAAGGPQAKLVMGPDGKPLIGPNRLRPAFEKAYIVPAEAVEKSYQMMDSAYSEYKAAKAQGKELPTGAQSMLALSTHLSTTFGNVKGARVTKDMIEHHLGARGISDSALVAIQRLTNGDVLSPDQWEAFHGLIKESRNLSWQTAAKEARRSGVRVDFLPQDVNDTASATHKFNPATGKIEAIQ